MPDSREFPPDARRAALFRNGRNQAVRIPKSFELPGDEVMVYREGNRLVVVPITAPPGLLAVLAGLSPIDEEFAEVEEPNVPLDDIELDDR